MLAALAAWTGEGRFQVPSLTFLVLVLGYTLVEVAPPADLFAVNAHPADERPCSLPRSCIGARRRAASPAEPRLRQDDRFDTWLQGLQPPLRTGAAWAAGVSALYGLSLTVMGFVAWLGDADVDTEFQRGHTTVSAVWATVGLVLLYLGLRRGRRAFRGAGFALFGVALAKIFLYDLSQLAAGRPRRLVPRRRRAAADRSTFSSSGSRGLPQPVLSSQCGGVRERVEVALREPRQARGQRLDRRCRAACISRHPAGVALIRTLRRSSALGSFRTRPASSRAATTWSWWGGGRAPRTRAGRASCPRRRRAPRGPKAVPAESRLPDLPARRA